MELAERGESAGVGDAPWPPRRKMEGEGARVAPSRAKSGTTGAKSAKKSRAKMPLIVVASSPDKAAALAGLERWKNKYAEAAGFLAPEDVLVDSMRGQVVDIDAHPNQSA